MILRVRNTGTQTVPNVAVSIDSFAYTSDYPELAANKRPIWVIETGSRRDPHSARSRARRSARPAAARRPT